MEAWVAEGRLLTNVTTLTSLTQAVEQTRRQPPARAFCASAREARQRATRVFERSTSAGPSHRRRHKRA